MANPLFDMYTAGLYAKMQLPYENQWTQHDARDAELYERYQNRFGKKERKVKDAKGFHSAADAAMRWPETSETTWKILAALYQLKSLAAAGLFDPSKFSPKDEYFDYLANVEGVRAAKNLMKSKLPKTTWEDNLTQQALHFADPFGDTTK